MNRKHRSPIIIRWTTGLAVLITSWLLTTALALADRPPLPSPMPSGYTVETHGAVRWIYPNSASDEARELITRQPTEWQALSRAFGSEISPQLDIRIGINPDDMRLLAGRQLPSYASGVAITGEGLILLSLTAPDSWLRPDMHKLLVHELSHVALHRAVGGHRIPRWFTEGVSIHRAGERSITRMRTLWEGAMQHRLIRVEQLSNAFPTDHHSVDLAYAQSADIVRYMLDGSDERARFRELLRLVKTGVEFNEAIFRSYHVSMGFLEREWRGQIQRRYGRWPSMLMGLTGVWAFAAVLLVIGYFRTRRRQRRTLAEWAIQEAAQDRERAAQLQQQGHNLLPPPPQDAPGASSAPPSVEAAGPQWHVPDRETEASGAHIDRVLDRAQKRLNGEPEVPTVDHEGRSHTLH